MKWGFGHHAPFLTPEERYYSLLYFFIFQCFVKNTVAITKLSFLFLYLDIFPQKKFRMICWAMIFQIAAGLVALSFTTIFQCTPVRYSWDKTIPGTWSVLLCIVWTGDLAPNALVVSTSRLSGMASRAGTLLWTLWYWCCPYLLS